MAQDPASRIERLRQEIREHDHRYHVSAEPTLSDREYDRLFDELRRLEAEHPELMTPESPTQRVGGAPIDGFVAVRHAVPMLSIDNTYDEQQVREFDERVAKGLDGEPYEYLVDPKIDGVAVSLRYEHGRLVLGTTRGDGTQGDDVTHNVRTLRAIPLKISGKKVPVVLEIRGEVFWPRDAFDRFNREREATGEPVFANPRNATAGTLKQLDPANVAGRGLSFLAHGIGQIEPLEFETQSELFDALARWGIPVSPHRHRFAAIDAVIRHVHAWDAERRTLPYETDGLVIKVNRFDQRDTLGATSRYPRWCIAYKYPAEQAESVVRQVDFQVGKLGTITPRAVMDPVQLSGTTVRHASLHNFDQVERLDVHLGDTVVVEKAGEIIPQVVRVVTEKRPASAKRIVPPKQCPVCGGTVLKDEGGVYIRCLNPACPAQIKERLRYFCGRGQMDIEGLGEVLIEKLVDQGLLHSYADLYKLCDRRDEMIDVKIEQERTLKDGRKTLLVPLGEKRVDTILEGVETSKSRPLSRVLAAMNIRHVGSATAELLAEHFGEMERIAEAEEEALQAVDGIGPELARSIREFFAGEYGRKTWTALRDAGVNMRQPRTKRSGEQPLSGKTLVVTGTLERFGRSEIEALIKQLGGKTASSVSKKTDFVVAGEKAGSKLDKARTLEIPILDEKAFLELIGRPWKNGIRPADAAPGTPLAPRELS